MRETPSALPRQQRQRVLISTRYALAVVTGLLCHLACAAPDLSAETRIAIIIDDMGNHESRGRQAIAIEHPLTFSFLPNTPHANTLARHAHEMGREVMVHLPMESLGPSAAGPGVLTRGQERPAFVGNVRSALSRVPHAAGLNNHMGSALTRESQAMDWLMTVLKERNLYFVDSRTTHETVALTTAKRHAVRAASRDVFLDNERSRTYLDRSFTRLLKIANQRGMAIGIAHPYPETLTFLRSRLTDLSGATLVPVSKLMGKRVSARSIAAGSAAPVES